MTTINALKSEDLPGQNLPTYLPGPFAEDYTALNWKFADHRDGETAKFSISGVVATVVDLDGDSTCWEITRGRDVLASGAEDEGNPPHFFTGLAKAEAALRNIVPEESLPARRI